MIGDKILDLILYEYHFSLSEGKISENELDGFRQQKTSAKGLVKVFDYYNLERYTKLHDATQSINTEIKHNIVESLAGAIFLAEGYLKTKDLVEKFIFFMKTKQ